MHTEGELSGTIKMPMRRVDGAEEWRIRAWIELTTLRGEWPTNTDSGVDYDAIVSGASDDQIVEDITARLLTIPGTDEVGPIEITRDNETASMTITITASHDNTTTTFGIGAAA